MAKETLRKYLNRMLKSKGATLTSEKKKASKYTSISAAKKAGSLYYTDKNGKVMAAVFATDLKDTNSLPKKSIRPKSRPPTRLIPTTGGGRGDGEAEVKKRRTDIESPTSAARRRKQSREGSMTLAEMRAAGLRAPKLSPKGKEAQNKIDSAKAGDEAAKASRAKRYTKDQWKSMSAERRNELGLPRSSTGVIFKVKRPVQPPNAQIPRRGPNA